MKNMFLPVLGGAALLAVQPVLAKSPPRSLSMIVIETGTCSRLTVADKDFSANCAQQLANFEYTDHRGDFVFSSGTKRSVAVSFSGDLTSEVHPDKDFVVSPVDNVIVNIDGKGRLLPAIGTCKFGNPYKGEPAIVTCEATTASGVFAGDFKTDGNAPNFKKLK